MLFETLKLLMARGVRLPEQVVVSSFPAPSLPAAKRPWRANKGMGDDAFKEECRTWSVNEVASLPPSTSPSLPPSFGSPSQPPAGGLLCWHVDQGPEL